MHWKFRRLTRGILLGIPLVLALAPHAHARAPEAPDDDERLTGTLFWRDAGGQPRPALALATEVTIRVSGLVARATVHQRFHNPTDLWMEGLYVFPLPEMAAVDRMLLQVGERRIEGVIRERARARRDYRKARREGRAASLLEQERPNLFTTSVANVGPGEPVEIQIEYQQTLRYRDGGFELRFPMTLTPRYLPGAHPTKPATASQPPIPLDGAGRAARTPEVPDARLVTTSTLHPNAPHTSPLRLLVVLEAGFPLSELASPSHAVQVLELGGDTYGVALRDVPADRDFVLRWRPERGQEPRLAIFSEAFEGEHYALLMLLPPDDGAGAARIPREAVFVIDTSGSMGGASIEQARAALHLALDRLQPADTFNVIAFDSFPRALYAASVPVTPESLRRAHRFVDELRANGGTEMQSALEAALHDPRGGDATGRDGRLRQVVFITDASIGNEEQAFATIERQLGRSRLFMVGIGSAPNAFFLNRAASLGRGTTTMIGSSGEVKARVQELFARVESPVLSDVSLRFSDAVEMWPERVPDLYSGEPVVVALRLTRFVGDVVLTGTRGGRAFELRAPLSEGVAGSGLHKLWARQKIAHWMMQRSAGVPAKRVREQVLEVALAHQLVSKFTSLVAVEVTPRRPASAPGARTRVPNHAPAGFDPAVPGLLPQGATPAALLLRVGLATLLSAATLALWRRWRGSAC